MKFSNLLIVTYGRTGSTLLMGILNSIPGVLVRGENMNLCAGLFAAYEALKTAKSEHGKHAQDSTKPFFGAECLDESLFLKDSQTLLKHQLVPSNRSDIECWGFKEIRYVPKALRYAGKYGLPQYLDFLSGMLPASAFIFLTRNREQVANSAFWKSRDQSEAFAGMALFEKTARQWSSARRDCFWIDYEEMLSGPDKLHEMFDFMGAAFDWATIQKVMSREHSYAGKPENLKNVVLREQGRQKKEVNVKAVNHEMDVEIKPSTGVEYVTVEVKPSGGCGEGATHLGGVVVLKHDQQTGSRLQLKGVEGEHAVQWGLPSPRMAKQFAGNVHAKAARYRVALPAFNREDQIALYLIDGKGERHCLAVICDRPLSEHELQHKGMSQ
jgi:hypothetical protein